MPRATYKFFKTRTKEKGNEEDEGKKKEQKKEDQSRIVTMEIEDVEMIDEEVQELPIPENSVEEKNDCVDEEGVPDELQSVQEEPTLPSLLRSASDAVLVTVAGGCIARESQSVFKGRLSILHPSETGNASRIWNYNKYSYNSSFFCNGCGMRLERSTKCVCKGSTAKFIRLPVREQLEGIVDYNFEHIRKIRALLKMGEAKDHNLSAPFFKGLWQLEENNQLFLSLLASIDGVNLHGHNKNKIWPVSYEIIDLPSSKMQKSENLILAGVIESPENPSTSLWNSIIKILYLDVETVEFEVKGTKVYASIASFTADQPAKRALFGMRAHHSACSCFYCVDEGTYYKWKSEDRDKYRGETLTRTDAEKGQNGFGPTYPNILEHLMPYDLPIDVLHDCGEGLLDVILRETIPLDKKSQCKTMLFKSDRALIQQHLSEISIRSDFKDCESRRNGSNKQNFFRIFLFEIAICTNLLPAHARIIIVGLGLLMNKLYSGAMSAADFFPEVCQSLQEFFRDDYHVYLSTKAHELLFHLPYTWEKFGNPGFLSTFSFESFYKFVLSDYHTSITKNFVETAATRFMTHICSRREVLKRFESSSRSEHIKLFMESIPHLKPKVPTPTSRLTNMKQEDMLAVSKLHKPQMFGKYSHSAGDLVSSYLKNDTKNDIVFYNNTGDDFAGRYVAAVTTCKETLLLIEPVDETKKEEQFEKLRNCIQTLDTELQQLHATRIVNHLKDFDGIVSGKLSGKRLLISPDCVHGVGVMFENVPEDYLFMQLNGLPIHA